MIESNRRKPCGVTERLLRILQTRRQMHNRTSRVAVRTHPTTHGACAPFLCCCFLRHLRWIQERWMAKNPTQYCSNVYRSLHCMCHHHAVSLVRNQVLEDIYPFYTFSNSIVSLPFSACTLFYLIWPFLLCYFIVTNRIKTTIVCLLLKSKWHGLCNHSGRRRT